MIFLFSLTMMIFSVMSILVGLFLFLRPAFCLEVQRKFYERINWRIEPISMVRELRNTKIMGLFLVVIAFLMAGYIILKIF